MVRIKKLLLNVLLLAVGTAGLVSCVSEQIVADGDIKTITSIVAYINESPQPKAKLDENKKLVWEIGDVIGVFSDIEGPAFFQKDGDGNVFSGSASVIGKEFYAFYPGYSIFQDPDNKNILYYNEEFFTTGDTPQLIAPMIAKSDGREFSFKHTAGFLHFSVTGTKSLNYVSLVANGDEPIAAPYIIDMDSPLPELVSDGLNRISTGVGPDPIQLSEDTPLDLWFVLPPTTFKAGFTLFLGVDDQVLEKQTNKSVTISRATVKNFAVLDLDKIIEEHEDQLTEDRNALIAFYNAMDGPNWRYNANWCSDNPVVEWSGVETNKDGIVVRLSFINNNLNGEIPQNILSLKHLERLDLCEDGEGAVTGWDVLFKLNNLRWLNCGIGDKYSMDFEEYESWMMTIPSSVGDMKNLEYLQVWGVKGPLPTELFQLNNLTELWLRWAWLNSPIPSEIGNLSKLETFSIQGRWRYDWDHQVKGPIPEELYNCKELRMLEILDTHVSGGLSPKIGQLTKLNNLRLTYNELSGPIPAELASIDTKWEDLDLRGNHFSGKVPEAFKTWPAWDYFWGYITQQNQIDFSEVPPHMPDIEGKTVYGEPFKTSSLLGKKMTVFFQWATWCPYSPAFVEELKILYNKYHDQGFELVSWATESESEIRSYIEKSGLPGICFSQSWPFCFPMQMWPTNSFPAVVAFDNSGKMIEYSIGYSGLFRTFVEHYFGGEEDDYESTDYSADGTVHTIQSATQGKGINLVLMGDAFSDRLIADGSYESAMRRATDALFSEEPYKSFRDCFNVYYVDVVSKNESYDGQTSLGTWFTESTLVGGDNDKVLSYAEGAIGADAIPDAQIIVLMNRNTYAGTCYMYDAAEGDYGNGTSISYVPISSDDTVFYSIVSHESGGHGFAKLADEYAYPDCSITDEALAQYKKNEVFGWWKNVDFTSDPSKVKWARFIEDNRYAGEGIGVYEGACTYYYGAFRSTNNSIMNDNTGGFNAPSRYAIWYRIGKLAFGPDWNGSYEDFVAYDAVNRTPAAAAARRAARRNSVEKDFVPLAPPVVIEGGWRQ